MDRIPLFVRGGAIIPSQQEMQFTDQAPIDPLTLDVYPSGTSSRPYYDDDGISFGYRKGAYLLQHMTVEQAGDGVNVSLSAREGTYTPPRRSLVIKIHGLRVPPTRVTLGSADLSRSATVEALRQSAEGWAYDQDADVVWVRVPDEGKALALSAMH
jgi:alpha-glucosidase